MEIIETKERNTASVRYRTPVSELPNTMGPVYGEIAAYMEKNNIPFAGPPFAMYYNMDMDDLDVEIGFPVAEKISGEGRVKPGSLPGGRMVTAKHVGSYASIEQTYNAVMDFMREKELVADESCMYEEYLNSPEDTPPEKLETNIYFILKG